MRNEFERNMNVLRGLLHACEEGATEALSDGSDGNEPWTEGDRRGSRRTADWIRATFFAQPVRVKPASKREPLYSDEQLWAEIDHPDERRRQCAMSAIEALADLAGVRANKNGTSFLAERRSIFDVGKLLADLRSNDRVLHDAAFRAWDEVIEVIAVSEAEKMPMTDEIREQARVLLARTHERLAEMDRAVAAREAGEAK